PSHTTGHAGPHPAVRRVELSSANQSRNLKRIEVSLGQCNMEAGGFCQPPWTMGAARRLGGESHTDAPLPQFSKPHRASFPLFPDRRPKPASEPLLKTLQHRGRFALPEVANPSPKVSGQFLSHPLRAHSSGPVRQLPNLRFEPVHRFRRYAPFWYACVHVKAEAQKLPFPWSRHRTLLPIDREPQLCCDVSANACHHALP